MRVAFLVATVTLTACAGGNKGSFSFTAGDHSFSGTSPRGIEYNPATNSSYVVYQGSGSEEVFIDLPNGPAYGITNFSVISLEDADESVFAGAVPSIDSITWTGRAGLPYSVTGSLVDPSTGQPIEGVSGTFSAGLIDCESNLLPGQMCGQVPPQGEAVFGTSGVFVGLSGAPDNAVTQEVLPQLFADSDVTDDGFTVQFDGAAMTTPSGLELPCTETGREANGGMQTLCGATLDNVDMDGCSYEVLLVAGPTGDYFGQLSGFLELHWGAGPECPELPRYGGFGLAPAASTE